RRGGDAGVWLLRFECGGERDGNGVGLEQSGACAGGCGGESERRGGRGSAGADLPVWAADTGADTGAAQGDGGCATGDGGRAVSAGDEDAVSADAAVAGGVSGGGCAGGAQCAGGRAG